MEDRKLIDRRFVLTRLMPAAALAGVGFMGTNALAQSAPAGTRTGTRDSAVARLLEQAYGSGEYRLPDLPYGYDALEPYISSKIMRIHHDKHHRGYVNGLNRTLKALGELRAADSIDMAGLHGLEKDLSFNTGGHVLHTLFWATMAPGAGGTPQGDIAAAIAQDFASFDSFRNYFSKVAVGVKGSGWALLGYEPIGGRLLVFQVNDHDLKLGPGIQPLLPLDVWEHAYYLQYENNRGKFIDAWWKLVNWPAVDECYRRLRTRR